ncbi:MAG TPA: DNA repair protein RecO [Candidatus Paceibacterota bacterium]|nr:DNA repair protein RecO [Candidatus Paceibacterota bacterium]
MRHKYQTRAIVLGRSPLGEANALITLLTSDLGLVRVRAQGIRKSSAKLASALATFSESELVLVKGSEGWRATGAVLAEQWHRRFTRPARLRAGRIVNLLLRLAPSESADTALFPILHGFFNVIATTDESAHDAAECLAALRLLSSLGLDAGEVPGATLSQYEPDILSQITGARAHFITRINRGIEASGL